MTDHKFLLRRRFPKLKDKCTTSKSSEPATYRVGTPIAEVGYWPTKVRKYYKSKEYENIPRPRRFNTPNLNSSKNSYKNPTENSLNKRRNIHTASRLRAFSRGFVNTGKDMTQRCSSVMA